MTKSITITEEKVSYIPQYYKNGKRKTRDKIEWTEVTSTIDMESIEYQGQTFYFNPNADRFPTYLYREDGSMVMGNYIYGYSGTTYHVKPILVNSKHQVIEINRNGGYDGPMGKGSFARLISII